MQGVCPMVKCSGVHHKHVSLLANSTDPSLPGRPICMYTERLIYWVLKEKKITERLTDLFILSCLQLKASRVSAFFSLLLVMYSPQPFQTKFLSRRETNLCVFSLFTFLMLEIWTYSVQAFQTNCQSLYLNGVHEMLYRSSTTTIVYYNLCVQCNVLCSQSCMLNH